MLRKRFGRLVIARLRSDCNVVFLLSSLWLFMRLASVLNLHSSVRAAAPPQRARCPPPRAAPLSVWASMSEPLRIGFLGAGVMAEALAKGFAKAGVAQAAHMTATDLAQSRRDVFSALGCVAVNSSEEVRHRRRGRTTLRVKAHALPPPRQVVDRSDVVFICVKPHGVKPLLEALALSGRLSRKHLLVSIAAGVTLADLESACGHVARVVRVMPNTPCMVGQTAAALCLGSQALPSDGELVSRLFDSVGRCYTVQEHLLDAVTGLSGSGPAYVFLVIEALSDGGVRAGLPRDIATGLAAQTVAGAAAMVLQTGKHTGELKDMVTSPGGTTIAGVHALESGGMRAALMDAVVAATNRAKELSKL